MANHRREYHFRQETTQDFVDEITKCPGVATASGSRSNANRYLLNVTKGQRFDWPEVEKQLEPVFASLREGEFGVVVKP